jgi:PAS domain S-box-containing protein
MTEKDSEKNNKGRSHDLRAKAKARLSKSLGLPSEFKEMTHQELVEELRVHQVELEMQNEELKSAQLITEESRDKYVELYNFAPVGYFTFNRDALIEEANLTGAALLGVAREELINQRIRKFIAPLEIDRWDQYFTSVLHHGVKQNCELMLSRADGSTFYAYLESVRVNLPAIENKPPEFVVRTTLTDITERRDIDEKLRVSEGKYRQLVEDSNSAIIRWSSDGTILFSNKFSQNLFGYGPEEMIGKHVSILVPKKESSGRDLSLMIKDIVDRPDQYINNINENICRDGRRLWLAWTNRALLDDKGKIVEILAIGSDITETKKLEQELRVLNSRHETLLAAVPELIMEVDNNKVYTWSNQAGIDFFGEDVIGKEAKSYFIGEQDTYKRVEPIFRGEETSVYVESWQLRKDGQKRLLSWQCRPLKDHTGKTIGALSSASDITEREQANKQVQLSYEILELLNNSDSAIDAISSIMKLVKLSTNFEAIGIRLREDEDFPYYVTNGFSEDFMVKERYLCQRDDQGDIVRNAQGNPYLECMCGNIISGRTDARLPFFTEGGSFWTNSTTDLLASTTEKDRQTRTRNKCNGEGYESVALIPLRSKDEIIGLFQFNDHRRNMFTLGMIKFFEGLSASIGIALERKKIENQIKHAAEEWRATFDSIKDLLLIVDKDFKIIRVNRAFSDIFRLEPKEVIGKFCYELVHGAKEPHHDCPVKKAQFNRTRETAEFFDTFLNRYLEVSVFHIFLGKEQNFGAVQIIRDITERKKMEEEMRKHLQELEVFYKASLGREERILELKKKVKELEEKLRGGYRESTPT